MIDSFLLLATESHGEGGALIGFHLDLWESNIINLSILVGVLVFYGRKAIGKILSDRRSQIAQAIQEVEARQKQAAAALTEEQRKLTQAQAEAERIRQAAQERAKVVAAEIAAQCERDVIRLRDSAAADLSSEQDRVIAQLKKQIGQMAVVKAEAQLKQQIDDTAQQRLIDRSIAQLGG
ncbi:F0F1 ATP synthase subunit B [Aphanothece sacrum]|uniref:ATP synthase subunit b n=1 Tax=Aphanothece sacrum FPU1 TaxID=1920663 RepID=A0A401IG33_APHSA|nr:F0F1 ATP synthase subunit B [Aphanothece sacrum]GBF80150.1 FoF1 ATP synthase subunit B [Aphanothece sacrum FPU1]GBF86397.1 FoF1 ATP synthase subunit B [Aphanothece sacrum FPU3]